MGAGWRGAGWLGSVRVGAGCRSVEDGAAVTRQGQFAIVDALLRDHLLDDRIVFGRGADVRAAFHERHDAAADEVNLEAKESVLRARRVADRCRGSIDVE